MPTPPLLIALGLLTAEPSGFDAQAVEQTFELGQQRYEEQEYVEAAEAFEQAFALVPASADNRAVREGLALTILHSYARAYQQRLDAQGKKKRLLLERARAFRDTYLEQFRRAHGDEATLAPALRQAFDELEQAIAAHDEREYEFQPCLTTIGPCLSPPPPCLQPIEPKRGCGGEDGDGGLAAALLLPLGLRRRRDVIERLADRLPDDVVTRLRSKVDDEA